MVKEVDREERAEFQFLIGIINLRNDWTGLEAGKVSIPYRYYKSFCGYKSVHRQISFNSL